MIDFTDLLILMVVIWTAGKIFRFLNLPVIFGELIGGIIVGPVIFNLVHIDSELIKVVAEFGIFFLMLHSGLETNPDRLLKAGKKSIMIAFGGALLPFFGGYLTSILFGYPPVTAFFVGMGISISAIAIGARLFKDHNMLNSQVANFSLGAAIIDDIIALILFSLALNFAEKGVVEFVPIIYMLVKVIAFFVIVIWGGNKISPHMNRVIQFRNKGFTLTLIMALLLGLIAEAIGLHMIIGAFLAGLFIRGEVLDKRVFAKIEDRIYGMSYSFFGPIFFASLAFHLDFNAFFETPYFMLAIVLVAIFGKMIGSGIITGILKMKPMESLAVGLALNNRGAVELIVASIGLQMGIIDKNIFSILVIMAFVTTVFSIVAFQPVAKRLKTD
ncbi:cation:proton antiporter [Patescibacteria group bacterium]|nr:cation:proton antiporter [Patescibacteria group bacterium]MBU1016075.1 cation:proton antiporter [Patescibacteria group bacterium]MBU1684907.1 cation:proton antiporter [Patescibacteria group bacterium]MBU1938365.1 cation:proton antiporter [Patescibacteria group bacterium]